MSLVILKNFEEQWNALIEKKDSLALLIPKLMKRFPIPKWLESSKMYNRNIIGAHGVPFFLCYETKRGGGYAGPSFGD